MLKHHYQMPKAVKIKMSRPLTECVSYLFRNILRCVSGPSKSTSESRKHLQVGSGQDNSASAPSISTGIETYHGLDESTAERVRRFETETKAAMQQGQQRQQLQTKSEIEISRTTSGELRISSFAGIPKEMFVGRTTSLTLSFVINELSVV